MYTTKPLSAFAGHPEAASRPPAAAAAEGGCSGYLAVKSDEEGTDETRCWGLRSQPRVRGLPFPQNRVITVSDPSLGEYADAYADAVVFVPVPGAPPSSNRYYAVLAAGKHRGLVRACSRRGRRGGDDALLQLPVRPRREAPAVRPRRRAGSRRARSVAADGLPYFLYRSNRWLAYASRPKNFDLAEALGLDDPLRSRSLTTPPPPPATASAVAVGRWYTPFFYVKEDGVPLKAQMDRSTFYEIVLEQRWEEAMGGAAPAATMASKRVLVGGSVEGKQEAVTAASARTGGGGGDGYVWFSAATTT
uniref:Uncharacterized protein n=1 Tax=Oryza meridionalis TaxID=40149 RepID=A0A0E0E9G2_9ORYZ